MRAPTSRFPPPAGAPYPMQGTFAVVGIASALAAALLFGDWLMGLCLFVPFALLGLLWPAQGLPVLPFVLAMQWIWVATGYTFQRWTGRYPGMILLGDLEGAVLDSLLGLLVLALAFRVVLAAIWSPPSATPAAGAARYDVRRLFLAVIAVNTLSWFVELDTRAYFGGAAEIVSNLFSFRLALLCMLVYVVLRQREGQRYAAGAVAYTIVPLFASAMSSFKEILFLVGLALLSQWKPWLRSAAARAQTRRTTRSVAALAVTILALGLLWEGSIKPVWRGAVTTGHVTGSPIEKVQAFATTARGALAEFDLAASVDALAARVSSGVAYLSLVLERVPRVLPHENGRMAARALNHVLKPRLLFPDKPILESDSQLVRKYTGVRAAGDESGTSIGLGYMAQLYIDFGRPWCFAALFAYGLLVGGLYRLLLASGPSRELAASAAAVVFVLHFLGYESELAKQIGGLLQTSILFVLVLHTGGAWLQRRISAAPADDAARGNTPPPARRRPGPPAHERT